MRKQQQIEGITLSYSYDGYRGDILAGIGSTDQTGNYVFPVIPSAAYMGGARASHYWLADGGFDTMYTLWNPEPDAQELLVTLKYGKNGESYKLPVTLESRASAMIDIGELIRTRQLDQDGKLLPADVKQGSLVVSGAASEPEDAIDVVVGMGIYNPTKATCGSGWLYCDGFVSPFMNPANFVLAINNTKQLELGYNDNSGWQYDVSSWSQWSSNNSQVISVDSGGLATGVGSGSTAINAFDPYYVPVAADIYWQGQQPQCPITTFGGVAYGTVPSVTIQADKTYSSPPAGFVLLGAYHSTTNLTANGSPSGGTYSWTVDQPLSAG